MVAHDTIAELWDGHINNELVDFAEYEATIDFMSESVEAQL
jgi:hypothetical protein